MPPSRRRPSRGCQFVHDVLVRVLKQPGVLFSYAMAHRPLACIARLAIGRRR